MERLTEKVLNNEVKGPSGLLQRFRKDEDGSLILFSIFMFVLILWFGGMAVDLMRFETTRAKLQGTLDRATLAAADLDQVQPPADVVRDYFEKAGMLSFLQGDPIVDEGINYRIVTANAEAVMPLFFYDLPKVFNTPFTPGMSSLTISGSSTAEERVTDVEVSLVLDVSGSMNSNNRIQNLRPAARDFVTTVLANNTNAPNGLITISMIPYSAVVNPGTDVVPFLTGINRTHDYSTCPLFDTSLFTSTALNPAGSYDHVSHFDPDWYSSDPSPIEYPWCHTGDHNSIVVHTTDESTLHTAINDLVPYGNTAIDLGVKWGVGLLDPSTQAIISGLAGVSGTNVPAIADGRPEAHTQSDVLKVLVLMTDGANTREYDLYDRFKNDLSFVWFDLENDPTQALADVDNDEFSVQYEGQTTPTDYWDDRFYLNRYSSSTRLQDYPNGYNSQAEYVNAMNAGAVSVAAVGVGPTFANNVRQASWQELYANWEHDRVNNVLLSRAKNHGAIPQNAGTAWTTGHPGPSQLIYLPDFKDSDSAIDYSVVNSGQADARLSSICAAARTQGIVIYTVAFEAPYAGRNALQDCASSPSHYFDVNGTDISAAFSAIASDIRALKLTQ